MGRSRERARGPEAAGEEVSRSLGAAREQNIGGLTGSVLRVLLLLLFLREHFRPLNGLSAKWGGPVNGPEDPRPPKK